MSDSNSQFCRFYILRHGETEWNRERRIQGQKDSKLTQEAIEEAKQKAKQLEDIKFDAVFSSDLARAKHTAELVSLNQDLAIETTNLLRERRFGVFEGKTWEEMSGRLKKLLRKLDDTAEDTTKEEEFIDKADLQGVESTRKLITRFITFLRQAAVAYPGKKVLVVTHGGVIGNFLVRLGYLDVSHYYQLKIENLALLVLESDGVEFHIQDAEGISLREETEE